MFRVHDLSDDSNVGNGLQNACGPCTNIRVNHLADIHLFFQAPDCLHLVRLHATLSEHAHFGVPIGLGATARMLSPSMPIADIAVPELSSVHILVRSKAVIGDAARQGA